MYTLPQLQKLIAPPYVAKQDKGSADWYRTPHLQHPYQCGLAKCQATHDVPLHSASAVCWSHSCQSSPHAQRRSR